MGAQVQRLAFRNSQLVHGITFEMLMQHSGIEPRSTFMDNVVLSIKCHCQLSMPMPLNYV